MRCPGVFSILKSQELVMRTGDLGSSVAFAWLWLRWAGHCPSPGLTVMEEGEGWIRCSLRHFKLVTFKISTQVHRLDRVGSQAGGAPITLWSLSPKERTWVTKANQEPEKKDSDMKSWEAIWAFRHHLTKWGWEPGLGSARPYLCLDVDTQTLPAGDDGPLSILKPSETICLWVSDPLAQSDT